jgi:hypothetical protein
MTTMRAEEKRCPLKRALVKHRAADVARKKRERASSWLRYQIAYHWHDDDRWHDFGERRQKMYQRRFQRSVESQMQQAHEWIRNRARVRHLRLLQEAAWVGIAIAVVVIATMLLTSCGYPCDRETVDVCVYGNVDVAQVERVKGLVETAMDERVGQVTVHSDSGAAQWEPYDQDTGELHIDFSRGCETAYLQLVHGLLHITAEHRGVNGHIDHTAPGLFRQVPLPNVESAFALSVGGMCKP